MASTMDTATFFAKGTPEQFEFVLSLYIEAVKLKAERKNKKPEELLKLDTWYQNELPKKIKSRGKDRHLIHEELVQTMKWKLARGKFYPQLSYLIKVNTPKAVISETRKAFRKLPNLEQAITALSNLKGVGTTMASALCAAAAPEEAPFMADECLMAIPDFEGIDYTTKEYLNFVTHIRSVVERLNKEAKNPEAWNPHRVELALWTHYVVNENKPELLEAEPPKNGKSHHTSEENGTKPEEAISDDSTQDTSSKDSPAPPAILSPEDSLLEPPTTTEDSLDAGTAEDESSREASQQARDLSIAFSEEANLPETSSQVETPPELKEPPVAAAAVVVCPETTTQESSEVKESSTETEEASTESSSVAKPEEEEESSSAAEAEPPIKRVKVDD